jgi:molecular chaperone DnaJ
MAKNYYEILGVDKKASKDDIKKAFRKLAHEHHPDKTGGDATKFKEASEAYSVLSDDKKRTEYDTYGRTFDTGAGGFNPGAGGFGGFEGFDFSNMGGGEGVEFDLGDIFGQFFGGGGRSAQTQRQKRGSDISVDIEITFSEAVFGVEKKITISKTSLCDVCHGNGAEPGSAMKTCQTCNGKGKVQETRSSLLGTFSTVRTCSTCNGSGKVPEVKCKKCHGLGVIKKQEDILVKIPAGINDGEIIRLQGAGEAVAGGAAGDLYVNIHVKKHPVFHKEGANIVMDLNIKLSTALLGGEYDIETLDGAIKLKIPAGISIGEVLRVKGKGVPVDRNKRGDLLVKVHIQLPTKLSRSAAKLIEELKKEGI